MPLHLTQTLKIKFFLLDYIRAIPVILYKRCMEPEEKWALVIVFQKTLKLKKKKLFFLVKLIPKGLKFLYSFLYLSNHCSHKTKKEALRNGCFYQNLRECNFSILIVFQYSLVLNRGLYQFVPKEVIHFYKEQLH